MVLVQNFQAKSALYVSCEKTLRTKIGHYNADGSPQLLLLGISSSMVQTRGLTSSTVRTPIAILRVRAVVLLHQFLGKSKGSAAKDRSWSPLLRLPGPE